PAAATTLARTASYTHSKTGVTPTAPNPAALAWLGANLERIGRGERGRIEEGAPRDKFALGAIWTLAQWDFSANAVRYGEFTSRHATNPDQDQTYATKWTLDTAVSFRPSANWTFTLGADNVLDEYPEKTIFVNSTSGMIPYSLYSPFGFNGRYVYGRIGYAW